MNEVRRYAIMGSMGVVAREGLNTVVLGHGTDLVFASDYDALAARLAEVEREKEEARSHIKKLEQTIARQRINLSRKYLGWAETKVGLQRTVEHLRASKAGETPLFGHGAKDELLASLTQQLAEAQATVARQQEQLRLCNIDQLQAEQQVTRLRESMEKIKDTATHGHGSSLDVFGWLIMIRDEATIALRETGA